MDPAVHALPHGLENSYKMTEEDVKRLIELRASNEALFTGKRNSAKIAWNTILRGLGLQGKLTADQIAKKWDNLRTKYKDLKQPYQGQEVGAGLGGDSWPWLHIMDDAMQGRLYNSSLVLSPEGPPTPCHHGNAQESADILEFLIKTEMEDTGTAQSPERGRASPSGAPPPEGVPMGWRRMSECSYKMTEPETERMIKLRAANEALFTGRKHSAKPAWRAILYELGLQGKVTTDQLAKKWDNLKRRYKELKFPSRGSEPSPSSWPWFYRMDDAMEGRFAGSAPLLTPIVEDGDEECEPSPPVPRKRVRRAGGAMARAGGGMAEFLTESEMDLLVESSEKNAELQRFTELTYKLTEEDTRRLIELRAANECLFTGRRNTAKPAWRGIVKEMGLSGKITPDQVAKKWDNLKTKFKDLRCPSREAEPQNPAAWPWFQLMGEALEGRLLGHAPRVTPLWTNEEEALVGSPPPPSPSTGEGGGEDEAEANVTYIDASGEECSTPTDSSYKMTEQDTRRLIRLRAANEALFTGKRNAAKAAWKAILKELGLLGKVSTYQLSKKWDNLKRRYKDLRFPPVGMETDSSASWPWFQLMNDAMEGRLATSAPLLTPITQDDEPEPAPRYRPRPPSAPDCQDAFDGRTDECPRGPAPCERLGAGPRGPGGGALEGDWQAVGREREAVERERDAVDRKREAVEREREAVERDRAAVQAERHWLEGERHGLERERSLLEQERVSLSRDREVLENQRALILNSVGHLNPLGM